jgi:hypothetical protein
VSYYTPDEAQFHDVLLAVRLEAVISRIVSICRLSQVGSLRYLSWLLCSVLVSYDSANLLPALRMGYAYYAGRKPSEG